MEDVDKQRLERTFGEEAAERKEAHWRRKAEELVGSLQRQLEADQPVAVSALEVGQTYLEYKGKTSKGKDILVWLMNNAPLALKNEEGQYLTLLDAQEGNVYLDPADMGKYYGPEAFTSGKAARKAIESALLPVRSPSVEISDVDRVFNLVPQDKVGELRQFLGMEAPERMPEPTPVLESEG